LVNECIGLKRALGDLHAILAKHTARNGTSSAAAAVLTIVSIDSVDNRPNWAMCIAGSQEASSCIQGRQMRVMDHVVSCNRSVPSRLHAEKLNANAQPL
jgi:hypothetical protein